MTSSIGKDLEALEASTAITPRSYKNLSRVRLPSHSGASRAELLKILDALVDDFHVRKIIAFGSCVQGEPNEHSDIDLCVIRPKDRGCTHPRWEARQAVARKRPRIAFDLLVLDLTEWECQQAAPFGVYRDVLERGVTLYEG
jgi:predicted nucleotidyltransferase